MIGTLAFAVVVLAGLYFAALGIASLLLPVRASRFLLGFADSALKHYAEMFLRLVVGAALILHAPITPVASVFTLFGWLLLATTACLVLVPWRWHYRFAQYVVPLATRHIMLVGLASLILGILTLLAALHDGAA